ncbi:MAG: hypothetical protein AAFN63_04760 [Pseudomonadota bacterium]
MSLIDQTPARSALNAAKATAISWRDYFFPLGMEAKIVWTILAVLTLWILAIFTFGVPALVWPMKIIVPGMVLSLVLLTWGM